MLSAQRAFARSTYGSRMQVDTASFMADLVRVAESIVENEEHVLEESAYELYNTVRLLTPVDTGEAKEGWEITNDGPRTYFVFNQVKHIVPLEFGWSHPGGGGRAQPKAPFGMMRVALVRLNSGMKAKLRAAMERAH